VRYDGRWRDRPAEDAPAGGRPAIRFRAPREGETTIDDVVRGRVTVANEQLDDMVLLRADGTPTYMLAVVVDDHDMGITHVVRGDDHFTNTFRQYQLYRAFGWPVPVFAHIPLIHGADGSKLSKRHGALGLDAYREDGFLPEAMCNYLLRLGWSHGDDEIIDREHAVSWFDLDAVGRSPARFDRARLLNLNAHYLRLADDRRLAQLVLERLRTRPGLALAAQAADRLQRAMPGLKPRAKTLVDLADRAAFYAAARPIAIDAEAEPLLGGAVRRALDDLTGRLRDLREWSAPALEAEARAFVAERCELADLAALAQPLRVALTGSTTSPPVFEVMAVLGREETLGRLADVLDPRETVVFAGPR